MNMAKNFCCWISYLISEIMFNSSQIPVNHGIDDLKIHAINVNSLIGKRKRHDLDLHLKKFKPDVVLLSETCLNKCHKVQFSRYNFIRSDKVSNRRGTGILIRSNFEYKSFRFSNIAGFEYTAIILLTSSGANILIVSLYSSQKGDFDDLSTVFTPSDEYTYIICGGDYNARHTDWSNSVINYNGLKLYNWLHSFSDTFGVELLHSIYPSRRSNNSFSYIDLFVITKNLNRNPPNTNRLPTIDYESDHQAVVLVVSTPKIKEKLPVYFLNYDKANWANLSMSVSAGLLQLDIPSNRNLSNQEIDTHINSVNKVVLDAIEENIPKVKMDPNSMIILKDNIIKFMAYKKRLRRRWFRGGCNNILLKSLILRLTSIIEELINMQYSDNLDKILKAIKPGPRIFKDIKKVCGYGKKKYVTFMDGCGSSIESAEKLALSFESVYNTAYGLRSINENVVDSFINELTVELEPRFHFNNEYPSTGLETSLDNYSSFTNRKKTIALVRSRRSIKTSGINGISNVVLKRLPISYIDILNILINNSFNNGFFPNTWKEASIVPVPKTVTANMNVSDYRPISLLQCDSKIFELFIKEKFNDHCIDKDICSKLQFGFCTGKSTSHAITYYLESMYSGFRKHEPCLSVTIDLKKAFDSVWIRGLVFKMKVYGFTDHFCKLMLSYLTDRSFRVRFGEATSSIHSITAGVPQGSVLGPPLFNMFISDFPIDWETNIKTVFFADDIILFRSDRKIAKLVYETNEYLTKIMDFFDRWKLTVNFDKCEAILFRKSEKYITNSQKEFKNNNNIIIKMKDRIITVKDSIKYLGILFQKKMSLIPHIDNMIRKANVSFALLRGVFNKKSTSTKVKLTCYKQLIRPLFCYGFPGWCSASSCQMSRVRSFERKVLYGCLPFLESHKWDIESEIFKYIPKTKLYEKFNKVKRIDNFVVESFIRFINRLEFSDIEVLREITDIDHLVDKYDRYEEKYLYKSFPPSYLYYLISIGKTHNLDEILTFYNRRYNSNVLDEYVYDLANPN